MSINNLEFMRFRFEKEKIRVLDMANNLRFYLFEITTQATQDALKEKWGSKTVAENIDNAFTWQKFLAAYDAADPKEVATALQQWGTLTPEVWAETIQNNSARVLAVHNGTHLKIEKVQAVDQFLGPVEYYAISNVAGA